MLYLYTAFSVLVIGTSLFGMDKKGTPEDPKTPVSCHMESKVWGGYVDKETGATHMTYKYHDGSKSTFITYDNSSKDKKK